MIAVEACPQCTGWHPQRRTCPRRKPQVPPGLRICRHCGHYHLNSTPDACSVHSNCKCNEKAKLKIEIEHEDNGRWTANAYVRDRFVFAEARTLEVLLEKLYEQLALKGMTR